MSVPDYPMVECCNDECGWKGHVGDCVSFHNDPMRTPYCPECQEVVEYEFISPNRATSDNTGEVK
jgi:hypothetical protein